MSGPDTLPQAAQFFESIDRLSFFAHYGASDAQLSARYAEAYASILRRRLAEVGAAITALSEALPSEEGSTRTQIRPRKPRRSTSKRVIDEALALAQRLEGPAS